MHLHTLSNAPTRRRAILARCEALYEDGRATITLYQLGPSAEWSDGMPTFWNEALNSEACGKAAAGPGSAFAELRPCQQLTVRDGRDGARETVGGCLYASGAAG